MTKEIKPADRVSGVQEYYLQRKMKEVAELNARGLDIVSLGIGGPDQMPDSRVVQTLIDSARQPSSHSYQLGNGIPELRRAFAQWYSRHYGVELNSENEILPLIGSKEGILHVSLAMLNPGDGVLVPDPGYPTYSSVSRLVGAEIFTYDLKEETGWQPDFDALERLPLDRIKLMWLNYPHMPTGAPARMEVFRRAVDFARRHGIVLVHDNPYSFILNPEPKSLLQVEGAKDVAIEFNSLSKSHNMAGWRMGMLATNPTFMGWIRRVKSNVDSGQFRPVMLAAAEALNAPDKWYEDLNKMYAERRRVAEKVMEALGCKFDPAQRGLFLWGRIPDSCPGSEAMADEVLEKARVFITPGFIFGKNGDRYVRISLCATPERLKEAHRRISEAFPHK
ncbi:MAG: aminotransferase class I/II-fold pyridoxal phosphate-dependent enzyme [Muribaculaceae bacterium]|nr:aminotransferase class I/II-fold pyridoxal phosphate-dependent enzyme [Muribaculaceae bacterium]